MKQYTLTPDEQRLIDEYRKQNPLPEHLGGTDYRLSSWDDRLIIDLSDVIDNAERCGASLKHCTIELSAYCRPYEGANYDDFNVRIDYYGFPKENN